jgi:DNA-binding MarR family transcriptional regulator
MAPTVLERLKQRSFENPYQEAILSLLVAADQVNRVLESCCEQYGVTAAQYNVLRILRGIHPQGHPRSEIIVRMIHVAPDVTRLIDRLERLELATRGKSESDGRLSLTFITPQGLALLDRMQHDIEFIDREIAKNLTESEAHQLAMLAEKVCSMSE